MTQQTINIGSGPNAGDGDPLRTAMTKANDNFDELYTDKHGHSNKSVLDNITNAGSGTIISSTERTKLSGIAAGATANSSDSNLLARSNHTGTQAATTVTTDNSGNSLTGATQQATNAEIAGRLDNVEGDQHTHANKTVLDTITNAGSGAVITSAERTKLNGIEANATADQTGAEIKAAYEGEADTNAFTDAEKSKLSAINQGLATTDNVEFADIEMSGDMTVAYSASAGLKTDQPASSAGGFYHYSSAASNLLLEARAGDGTSDANIKLFRYTNTTGAKRLQLHKGDSSAAVDIELGVDGRDSYFDSGGNVAIGTKTAAYRLTVQAADSDWVSRFYNADSADGYGLYVRAGAADGSTESFRVQNANGTNLFNVHGDGHVDIGTNTAKLAKVQIGGSGTDNEMFRLRWDLGTSIRSMWISSPDSDSLTAPFRFNTNNSWAFAVDGTDALTIDDAGNVGIGSGATSPGAKLEVDGVAKFKSYTMATLPTVVAGGVINITDEIGGETLAMGDSSSNWRRVTDRAIAS